MVFAPATRYELPVEVFCREPDNWVKVEPEIVAIKLFTLDANCVIVDFFVVGPVISTVTIKSDAATVVTAGNSVIFFVIFSSQ